ncbi:MAG: periplasmic heavy metal sensor [Proteobacteria bacterium]|nr:periplasmic heavy metal sensor [Pseudomonadota bacterium]
MSTRLVQGFLALSLLLNTFVIAGFVFRGWIAPPAFEHLPPPPPPPVAGGARNSPVDMLLDEVRLGDDQRQALRPALDAYAAGRRERGREIQKLREQVSEAYRRSPLDPARIDPLIDQLTRLRSDQQKDTVRVLAQVEDRLTAEQRTRFHEILAERLAGPPRPPGGPGGSLGGPPGGPPGGRPPGGRPPGPPLD